MSGGAEVLILGGTAEARALAQRLDSRHDVISSLAGRVSRPRLPAGRVRIGGFGGVDGMRQWLADNGIRAVVDATHPFATTITDNAVRACASVGIPLLRLRRPEWTAGPGDEWRIVPTVSHAAAAIPADSRRVLLTTGRQDAGAFADVTSAWFLIRVVDPPTGPLPPHHEILRARGPYHLDAERDLLRRYRIDTLVTKNSGGELTRPKLDAARSSGVRVVMVARPPEPSHTAVTADIGDAVVWIQDHLGSSRPAGSA